MGLSIMKDGAKGKGKKLRDPFVALKKYEPQQNTLIWKEIQIKNLNPI